MKTIRRWRHRRILASGLREACREKHASNEVSQQQYEKIIEASHDNKVLDRTLDQLETNDDAFGAIDWTRIKEWIKANWPTLLRILFTAVMLLEPEEKENK